MVINEWFAGPPYFMERNGTFGKHKTAMHIITEWKQHWCDRKNVLLWLKSDVAINHAIFIG